MSKDGGPTGVRLQKVLANAGLGSKRKLERRIEAGEVTVNGKVAKLGDRVTIEDRITLGNHPVDAWRLKEQKHQVIIYNKPEGKLVTRDDPEGRPTVFMHLPKLKSGRWISVGRLDIKASGLIIFTTDGDLANQMTHSSHQIEREYAVHVHGEVTDEMLQQMTNGIELEDGMARFEDIVESRGEGTNRWYNVVTMEGRKREVRRLFATVGIKIIRLNRVRYGPILLDGSLSIGRHRVLDEKELHALLQTVNDKKWSKKEHPECKREVRRQATHQASQVRRAFHGNYPADINHKKDIYGCPPVFVQMYEGL
ncbi:MAG: pseudouridine synthase [Candidatus Sedimenticola sp. (ex Thyasira tokunagai)]